MIFGCEQAINNHWVMIHQVNDIWVRTRHLETFFFAETFKRHLVVNWPITILGL